MKEIKDDTNRWRDKRERDKRETEERETRERQKPRMTHSSLVNNKKRPSRKQVISDPIWLQAHVNNCFSFPSLLKCFLLNEVVLHVTSLLSAAYAAIYQCCRGHVSCHILQLSPRLQTSRMTCPSLCLSPTFSHSLSSSPSPSLPRSLPVPFN